MPKRNSFVPSEETQIAVMARDITYIREKVDALQEKLENEYVTKDQFDPIKRVVYGTVAMVLTSVGVAVLALVVKK